MKLTKLEIKQFRSSDISALCFRSVYHRHRGEVDGLMESALYTGCLNDELMNRIHLPSGLWAGALPVEDCMAFVAQKAKDEGRTFSDTVEREKDEIAEEVAANAEHYRQRMFDYFAKCQIIGVQIDMSFTIESGIGVINFGTKNDLMFRNPNGDLVNADFKWKKAAQTVDELSRHPQPAMMHLAIVEGQCNLAKDGVDDWVEFNEMPLMWWIDSARFKPYMKQTGEFKKGDTRPLNKLITEFKLTEENHEQMKEDLIERPVMASAGLWPKSVGEHCNYCPSLRFCKRNTASYET